MSTTALTPATELPGTPERADSDVHRVLRIVRLHYADRMQMIWVPLIMLASVTAVCVVIMLVLQALTPATPEQLSEGFRYNQAVLWSWPGFIVTIGVYAYARTMPYAIGMMGSTRRHYWAGTALWIVVQSAYLAGLVGLFLGLELVTGHWFSGTRMVDVYAMGNGDLGLTLLLSFAIAAACLSVGSGLASVYLRWGQYGVLTGIAVLVVIILGTLALVLASDVDVAAFFATDLIQKAAALLLGIAVLANAVAWAVIRRVPVGR